MSCLSWIATTRAVRQRVFPLIVDGPIEKPHTLPDTILPVETPKFDSVDWFRELLPVELTIVQGSVVLGSDATPMILLGDFKRANGLIEIIDVSLV